MRHLFALPFIVIGDVLYETALLIGMVGDLLNGEVVR